VTTEPFTDRDSRAAIDEAAAALSADRADDWAGDTPHMAPAMTADHEVAT
jgi:hypothetical protein